MNLSNCSAIVTGASHGIGLAITRSLLEQGTKVAAFARSDGDLPLLLKEFDNLILIKTDVSDERSVHANVKKVIESFGRFDILINNAGISVSEKKNLEESDLEECARVININLLGTYYMCHAAIPFLKLQEVSYLINILSTVAFNSSPGKSIYTASKFGLRGLTDALIKENRSSNLRVSSISPGGTDTNIWNLKKVIPSEEVRKSMLKPEDVARAALFLLQQPDYVHIEDLKITSWHSLM